MVTMFIFQMQFLWLYMDDLMGKGLEFSVILKLLILASARLVNYSLPMAILMSSIMTFGSLAEHYELTAMKSAGASLFRIMRPLIVFILFVGMGAFYFSNNIWPIANLKFRTLLYSVVEKRPALNLPEGVFYNGIEGFSIRVDRKDPATNELENILIYDHRDEAKGNRTVISAKRGVMEQKSNNRILMLTLHEGYSYNEELEPMERIKHYPHFYNTFEKDIIRMDLSAFMFEAVDENLFKNRNEMMTIRQLNAAVDSLDINLAEEKSLYDQQMRERLVLFKDSLIIPAQNEANPYNFAALPDVKKRRIIELTREMLSKDIIYLDQSRNSLTDRGRNIVMHELEWHRKFFFAFACVVLFFIGAPLGAIIRKGGLGLPTVVAFILFITYHLLQYSGERMVKSGSLPAWQGMWLASVVLFPISVFLTYKAATDASIMDKDAYRKVFQKISRIFRKSSLAKSSESTSTLS